MATLPAQYELPLTGLDWLEYYNLHNVYHPGVDFNFGSGNQDLGAPVVSILNGKVEYVAPLGKNNGGFGNFIIVEYPQYGVWARYAHLNDVLVRKGDKVEEGQKIATVGNTGTRYAHLHFEIFNLKLYSEIADAWRGPFRFYPSGKTKDWIKERYLNPWKFIESVNDETGNKQTALDWCKEHLPEADWEGVEEGEAERFRALARRMKGWFV